MHALRRRIALRAVATAVSSAALLADRSAQADSCTSPDLIETIPADGAQDVPTNAMLFARYVAIAQYSGEAVLFSEAGSSGPMMSLTGTFDATSGLLQIQPPLSPGTSFVVQWPALRGIDTATLGSTVTESLTTGTRADDMPPTFAGLTSIAWDVSRTNDSCTNSVDERYTFDLGLGAASDDGGRDSLTVLVFQTSGPTVDASVLVQVQRIPPAGQHLHVVRSIGDAVGHVCFAAIVRDLTLKQSTSGSPVCVDTVAPPFFYGCSAGDARSGSQAAWLAALAALALLRRRPRVERTSAAARSAGAS